MNQFPHSAWPILIGDVGGTNARFQILQTPESPPVQFEPVRTTDFKNLQMSIEKSVLPFTSIIPKTAIIAAAGSVSNLGLKLTNSTWNIRPEEFLGNSPFRELILINDFEAQSLSLPFMKPESLHNLGGIPPSSHSSQTKAVLGPGTGLGVGVLVRAENRWIPVSGEGGHSDIGPQSHDEMDIWSYLKKILGHNNTKGRIAAEQILSGQGLLNLYKACCLAEETKPRLKTPETITKVALDNSNPQAVTTLNLFCTCLGRFAGDLALTSMAKGGVYISGGIVKEILPFLSQSGFRSAFENKAPHNSLLQEIPTFVVTHELPALVGLAAFANDPASVIMDIDNRRWRRPQMHEPDTVMN